MNKFLTTTAVALTMAMSTAAFAASDSGAAANLKDSAACTPRSYDATMSSEMHMKLDGDRSGGVDMQEYTIACMDPAAQGVEASQLSRDHAEKNFKILDSNDDGSITADEYAAAGGNADVQYSGVYDMDEEFASRSPKDVIGRQVIDDKGMRVGTLEQIVHSKEQQQAEEGQRANRQAYSVIKVTDYLGGEEKMVAYPVNRVRWSGDSIVLRDASVDEIKATPDYDPNVYMPAEAEKPIMSKEDRLQSTN